MALKEMRDRFFENFDNYRLGIPWDANRRKPFKPLEGDAPIIFIPVNVDARQLPFRVATAAGVNLDTVEDLSRLQNSIRHAHNELQRLKDNIMSRGNGERFVYQRCLGWGGYGLAAVFDIRDENGQKIRGIVVKILLKNDEKLMEEEVAALKIHARSEHIIQLAETDRELLDQEEDPTVKAAVTKRRQRKVAKRRQREADSEPQPRPQIQVFPAIMLELLENGDLSNFITKVRERNETVPNRILWRFFLCLVRMCIGLAYPPDKIEEYNDQPGPITETVPDRLKNNPSRIVHFDMDPKNIFVGDFVGEEHKLTPLLKLGDFGLATKIEDNKLDSYYERFRDWGKLGFLAPEQFCLDWDYIPRGRNRTVRDHPIAGNYRWHTNLWGVGMIMECLVTLCYPQIPPMPTESTSAKPKNKPKYWTHGGHLLGEEYNHVDKQLRTAIMRCQAHFPEYRPKLHALEAFLLSRIKRDYADESDDSIADWLHMILYDVPPGFLGVGNAAWGAGQGSFAQPVAPSPSPAPGQAQAQPQSRPASVGPVRRYHRC